MNAPIVKPATLWFCSYLFFLLALSVISSVASPSKVRKTELFTKSWQFFLGDVSNGQDPALDDSQWRTLDLPHDWSIEGKFSRDNPATPGGGA
jgi:beta-galactosidase